MSILCTKFYCRKKNPSGNLFTRLRVFRISNPLGVLYYYNDTMKNKEFLLMKSLFSLLNLSFGFVDINFLKVDILLKLFLIDVVFQDIFTISNIEFNIKNFSEELPLIT